MPPPDPPLVIVCGLHDEGLRTVEQLHAAGARVVMVDEEPDQRLVPRLVELGVPHLRADARLPETLQQAGIEHASALVCVESDDLQTLATALLARQLRPDLRVVAQLRNDAVGRALGGAGVEVLDVARLAAPALVRACLRTDRWRLHLAGRDVVMVETVLTRYRGTLRDAFGDLAPIAVVRGGQPGPGGSGGSGGPGGPAAVEVSPSRDVVVGPGDRLHLLGTPAEVEAAGLRRPGVLPAWVGARAGRAPDTPRRDPWLRGPLRALDRRVLLAVGAMLTLFFTSVSVLMLGYREPDGTRMSVLDAVYFTVETIGTVGYGDFYFRDQDPWLRLWAVVLMIVGATLATVLLALLTNALIARRIEEALGRRRLTRFSGHVIVVGLGSVGVEVVRLLRAEGVDVVVVDDDPVNRFRGEVDALRVPVVVADATLPDTWRALRLEHARAVAVLVSEDLVSIETALVVRELLGERWREVPVVLRVFGRRLATTVADSFGFRHVRSPAVLAAPWFVGVTLGWEVVDTFYVGDLPLVLARVRVGAEGAGGGLAGVALSDLPARVRVLLLERAPDDGAVGVDVEHNPRRDTRLRVGDVATVVGPVEELTALMRADGTA
ncbi:NAD-binding protein [Nocardioides sp.]|uniref:NAD-binding protein n=1 Tax=Nocardioides sp. TaxID=35761 RepID=UPI0035152079